MISPSYSVKSRQQLTAISTSEASPIRIAELCSDADDIAKVLALSSIPKSQAREYLECVYVISPADLPVAKVGVAVDPLKRLSGLQCGNWNRLYIRSIFWCLKGAYQLEAAVHAQAKKLEVELVGEWLALDARDAAMLVAKVAKTGSWIIGHSGQYLSSWLDAMAAVEEQRRAER